MSSIWQKLYVPKCVKQHFTKICAATAVAAVSIYLYYQYKKNSINLSSEQINSIFNISSRKDILPIQISQLFNKNYCTNYYYIEHNGFLSNHLSHGIISLYKLNANNNTIKLFIKKYENKLEKPTKNLLKIKSCDWYEIDLYLGQRKNFYGIFNMMKNDLNTVYNDDIYHMIKKVCTRERCKIYLS